MPPGILLNLAVIQDFDDIFVHTYCSFPGHTRIGAAFDKKEPNIRDISLMTGLKQILAQRLQPAMMARFAVC